MIRIRIEYDNISPFLRSISGTLYVEECDETYFNAPVNLFKCKISKTNHVLGYSVSEKEEGIPSELFKCIKPVVDTMISSYWKGLVLAKGDFNWIEMKGDDSWQCLNRLEKEVGSYIARRTQNGTNKEVVLSEVLSCQKK